MDVDDDQPVRPGADEHHVGGLVILRADLPDVLDVGLAALGAHRFRDGLGCLTRVAGLGIVRDQRLHVFVPLMKWFSVWRNRPSS